MGKRMTGEDRLLHEPRNFTRQETHTRITLHSSLNSTGEGFTDRSLRMYAVIPFAHTLRKRKQKDCHRLQSSHICLQRTKRNDNLLSKKESNIVN